MTIRFLMMTLMCWGVYTTPGYTADHPKGPMKISADTALEWRRDDHQYIARGNVVITQDDMTLMADQVVADYHDKTSKTSDTKSSSMDIYRLTARGKTVTLKTATETAVGTKAMYDKTTNLAILEGPVTITRGKDVLRGSRATVDLITKKSTLLGDPKSGGRVTGVFYTEEVKGK
jgi:lipopolysaccharide export system protein LptA